MNVIVNEQNIEEFFKLIDSKTERFADATIRYLDFKVHVIRLVCYTTDAVSMAEKEFGDNLKNYCREYDSTIVIWKEDRCTEFADEVLKCLPDEDEIRIRAEMFRFDGKYSIRCFESDNGNLQPVLRVNVQDELIEGIDRKRHSAFLGYRSYEPEVFVKQGHAFVRIINALIKSENINLTHGAVFGVNGNGILLCGRGKRGKSTLTVNSMLRGFEFVSDDYQILQKNGDEVSAYPVYSIITLSYRMYNEMYDRFKGKFVCNNFTQEKYIFNISSYGDQFRSAYPIRMCLFPEITADDYPSIALCNKYEKGRAIVQFIHSTVTQMDDGSDAATIRKLFYMIKDLPFYKFNLCDNIEENTHYLEHYLKTISFEDKPVIQVQNDSMFLDITYGLATILDIQSAHFICMNKFATNVFQMVMSGITNEQIINKLTELKKYNPDICTQFEQFSKLVDDRLAVLLHDDSYGADELNLEYAKESGYKLLIYENYNGKNVRLIK